MSRDKQLPMSKKDKQRQKQEKKANRPLAVGRILIVCEGEKTEPNYFKWWAEQLNKIRNNAKLKAVGQIDIDDEIEIHGEGRNTVSLVEKAIKLRDRATVDYTKVWCVFDRDKGLSIPPEHYNNAINCARKHQFGVAYTNDAFELWYILHFQYRKTGLKRDEYQAILTKLLSKKYKKNDPKMYETLLTHPKADQQKAIQNAKKLLDWHKGTNYAEHNPSTTVHELVESLNDLVWQFRCQVAPAYPLPYPHDCEQCKKSPQPPSPCLK